MNLLIIVAVAFFFGIGFIFELFGFIFKILLSGTGLLLGVILASVLTIGVISFIVGIIGVVIPRGLIIAGIIFLVIAASNRTRRYRHDERYDWR